MRAIKMETKTNLDVWDKAMLPVYRVMFPSLFEGLDLPPLPKIQTEAQRRRKALRGIKLKPCPFCGGAAKLEFNPGRGGLYSDMPEVWVACTGCQVRSTEVVDPSRLPPARGANLKAAKLWNARQ
jgi:hypothetical protein